MVCAVVGGTAIRHSTRCAGRRGHKRPRDGRHNSCCAWWQYHPLQRRPYRGQFLYWTLIRSVLLWLVPRSGTTLVLAGAAASDRATASTTRAVPDCSIIAKSISLSRACGSITQMPLWYIVSYTYLSHTINCRRRITSSSVLYLPTFDSNQNTSMLENLSQMRQVPPNQLIEAKWHMHR